ncbi:MAG: SNF2-related protein [Desulfurococcaceae archaeon]
MSMNTDLRDMAALLKIVLKPLYEYNPFFSLYYNPLVDQPQPHVTFKPYYNYIHQVSLLLDLIPRSRVRILIGDEVGLGKTVEAIRIIKYLLVTNQARRILIIAPKTLTKQWLYHDIRDLLYSPRRVRRITRKTIDELYERSMEGIDEAMVYLAPLDLVKRGKVDRHTRGYFKPYYDFISSIKWDLVVVDEAHLLGATGTRSSLRTKRLAPICESAKHLVLLSATPSRGTHEDFLGRLALLAPELKEYLREIARNSSLRRNIYKMLSDYVVYRRSKEFVNIVERSRVFTDLTSLMALIKLGDKKNLYEDLGRVVSIILRSIGQDTPALVKVIILRRALSSPYAFLRTMSKVLEERAGSREQRIKTPIVSERILEEKADFIVEKILRSIAEKIPSNVRLDVLRLVDSFKELYEEGDPSFKALAHLLYNVVMKNQAIPRELIGDYVVFSEYRDTVEYVYSKLIEFFENKGFERDENLKNDVIERTMRKYYEKKYFERTSEKYVNMLRESIEILVENKDGRYVFLARLSSLNQDIIHLISELVESIDEIIGSNGLKVLVSTDIASEGLNLYQFNIVVNYDVPWSPVKREQRIGRVHRLRQSRRCTLLDFVRDVTVDYEFYTKLVLKLLNLAEQRIQSKPLEGVIELYITTGKSGDEYLQLSEMDITSALCRVYEDYYVHGKHPRDVLSDIKAELARKLEEYKDLLENLETRGVQPGDIREYVKSLTGCEDHQCFKNVVCELYSFLTLKPCTEVSKMLLEIYEKTINDNSIQLDPSIVILARDPGVSNGFIGIVDLVVNGNTRYSMPILVLSKNGEREVKYGIEVINWLVNGFKNHTVKLSRALQSTSSVDIDEARANIIPLMRSRFNLLFRSRLGRKTIELAKVTRGSSLFELGVIDVVLKPLVIRVLGVHGIDEYEKYVSMLPAEQRAEMEKKSVEYIKELFENKSCKVLEVNIGVYKPYDLLVECVEDGKTSRYMVEVKSHLKMIFVAELTPGETELAEQHPDNYIVCNVAGLEKPDKSSWITMCDLYSRLKKELVTMRKEEKIARLYFT